MLANRDAFRAFLNSGSTRKSGVTGVTVGNIKDLARHTTSKESVTGVTEPAANENDQEAEVFERQSLAEIEGGVLPLYSATFARLQVVRPEGLSLPDWSQAIDDPGRFLDSHGAQAERLGWTTDDLFSSTGLVLILAGHHVVALARDAAMLSDGRRFHHPRIWVSSRNRSASQLMYLRK